MTYQIGIISYFGSVPERIVNHKKQLNWFLHYFPTTPIHIIAQCYREDEYTIHPNITYTKLSDPVLPSVGRNMLLDKFYSSDNEFLICLDDDSVLYDTESHSYGNKLPFVMEHIPEKVDLFYPLDPSKEPFRAKWNSRDNENNLYFRRSLTLKTSFWILRNNSHKIMFDTDFFVYEDSDFALQMTGAGCGVYILENLILKEYGQKCSVLLKDGNRVEKNRHASEKLVQKYKPLLSLNSRGNLNRLKFAAKYSHHPQMITHQINSSNNLFLF